MDKLLTAERPAALCPDLAPQAELAVLTRVLYRLGYRDHTFGHITYKQPDGTFLVTPFELEWDEVTPADIMRMDADGNTLEGQWTITPAIVLHTELHKARPDILVAAHNHPPYGTIYTAAGRIPPAYDQTSAMAASDDIVLFNDYVGNVSAVDAARANVAAVGDKNLALLANHGVLVLGSSIASAYFRCSTLEWRCRLAWHYWPVPVAYCWETNGVHVYLVAPYTRVKNYIGTPYCIDSCIAIYGGVGCNP